MINADELEQLRATLVERFETHPPSTWSPKLLAAVVAVIDVEYDAPPPEPSGPRRLNLVPDSGLGTQFGYGQEKGTFSD